MILRLLFLKKTLKRFNSSTIGVHRVLEFLISLDRLWGVEMNLQVNLLEGNSVQQFKIIGEIDAFTAPVLKERLAPSQSVQGMQAELDLSEVAYMDSTGLGIFVGYYKAVKANGGHVKITGVNTRLKRLFEITGLSDIMNIEAEEGRDKDATV
jgi:anti-sigma B factor antagonist